MTDMSQSITTPHGTTITLDGDGKFVFDHPSAPDGFRNIEAGRLVYDGQGFQPAPFFAGGMRADALRAVADLIENKEN